MSTQIELDLIAYKKDLILKKEKGKHFIFDPIRRKDYVLLPEEYIRQLILLYFINTKEYPKSFISVERTVIVNTRKKRFDILIYNKNHKPWLMVECKAANVPITQAAFDQIARYNITLNVPYLLVTNGLKSYCCAINHEDETYTFLATLPDYPIDATRD